MTIGFQESFPHGQSSVKDDIVVIYAPGHGRRENENQDAYWPNEAQDVASRSVPDYLAAGRLYIVADGVSGCTDGRLASDRAVREIAANYYKKVLSLGVVPVNGIEEWLHGSLVEAILVAHECLIELASQGMSTGQDKDIAYQTTCACALIYGNRLFVAHVGDSRVYLLSKGSLKQLTTDADHVDRNGKLLRALGGDTDDTNFVGWREQPLQSGDIILLCTDGVYKEFADTAEMARYLVGAEDLAERCRRLYTAANGAAEIEKDDMTLLAIDCRIPSPNDVKKLEMVFANNYSASRAADGDHLRNAIDALEAIDWWLPDHKLVGDRTSLQMTADLYAQRSRVSLAAGDKGLAVKLLQAAERLGYGGLTLTARKQYQQLVDEWQDARKNLVARESILDRLLTLRWETVAEVGDDFWNTLASWLKELLGKSGAGDWERVGKHWALTEEIVAKFGNGKAVGARKRISELFETYWIAYFDAITAATSRLPKDFQYEHDLVQNLQPLLTRALILTKLLWSNAANGQFTAEDMNQYRISALTITRVLLGLYMREAVAERQFAKVNDLADAYGHWPEIYALNYFARRLQGMRQKADDPAEGTQRSVLNALYPMMLRSEMTAEDFRVDQNDGSISRDQRKWRERFERIHSYIAGANQSSAEDLNKAFKEQFCALCWSASESETDRMRSMHLEDLPNKQASIFQAIQNPEVIDRLVAEAQRKLSEVNLRVLVRSQYAPRSEAVIGSVSLDAVPVAATVRVNNTRMLNRY